MMIRIDRWVFPIVLGMSSALTFAQPPAPPNGPAPSPSPIVPPPAHSEDPPRTGGAKANPADAASPPLADPLKQQAVTDPPPSLATPEVQFISQASMEGLAQVQMAELAIKQSGSPKVRQFARRVAVDQRSMDLQLGALAGAKGTSVPGVLDSDHAGGVQKLGTLSGHAFDAAYLAEVRAGHDRALALYTAASSFSDAQVARFATQALPALRSRRTDAGALN